MRGRGDRNDGQQRWHRTAYDACERGGRDRRGIDVQHFACASSEEAECLGGGRNLECRILGQQRQREAQPLAQTHRRTEARPVLFLVHGSSNSSRSSYDLHVPGKGEYSLMNVFARYGYDVWTMDHDGYGRSGSSGNNSDIASGVEDLKAAIPVVMKETGQAKMHFYGTSSGAIRAGAYAQAAPERVDRLVLTAFTHKGIGSPEIGRRQKRIEELRANTRRKRDAAMISSIFSRDGHASAYEPAMIEALIAAELKFGDTIPTGTYLDMAANLPLVDPKKVLSPVLMLRGVYDGNSTNEDLIDFYLQLPNGDRQFVILPHTAHSVGYSKNRHLLWYAMRNFLAAPAPAVGS
jgi:pimeloyl-ACP methyl ester carboxylesterase